MNRSLLLILLFLTQLFIAYKIYRLEKYTEAIFAVQYFGPQKAEVLAAYVNLKKELYTQNNINQASLPMELAK